MSTVSPPPSRKPPFSRAHHHGEEHRIALWQWNSQPQAGSTWRTGWGNRTGGGVSTINRRMRCVVILYKAEKTKIHTISSFHKGQRNKIHVCDGSFSHQQHVGAVGSARKPPEISVGRRPWYVDNDNAGCHERNPWVALDVPSRSLGTGYEKRRRRGCGVSRHNSHHCCRII